MNVEGLKKNGGSGKRVGGSGKRVNKLEKNAFCGIRVNFDGKKNNDHALAAARRLHDCRASGALPARDAGNRDCHARAAGCSTAERKAKLDEGRVDTVFNVAAACCCGPRSCFTQLISVSCTSGGTDLHSDSLPKPQRLHASVAEQDVLQSNIQC